MIHQQLPRGSKHGFNPKYDILHKHQSSADPSMERATKWDRKCLNPSTEVYQSFDHLKLLVDHQMIQASSVENKLKAELDWAKARISKLESKRHSSKKKMEHILKKHAKEKATWRITEHEKIQAVIDGMKDDLCFEKKNRRRAEILNSKLIDELTEAKKSAKRFFHDYEKEKKARELLENVCDQLAKEVGEDREEVEESKRESIKAREELEEEKKMLQMAEVWREERVQMKLIDAKLALENQCSQLKMLQNELESFLRSRNRIDFDDPEIKEAELLIKAVAESVKIQEMEEFRYQPPPASEDILSIFEDIQQREEPKDRVVEQCSSKLHTVSPATDIFLAKPTNFSAEEDDSEWETLSRGDLGSSNSLEGSDETNCGINDQLWPASTDNVKHYKKTSSVEVSKEKISNGGVNDINFSPSNLEQWSSPETVNPHVTKGMKGCIEWPRGVQKQSLKTKLMEARFDSSKVQIRHVLKQKI
ncbi:LOW QUALITY PROTEIN: uncharacterized protein At5g41620-like [Asparagus officinalis]|uniref:LOW QUALITY PROTEIN: uncharacterized protein At5g41620-like n=1 Tax=Asparagus officinalis TaxID=4686 RepID=UPI00098DF3E5|nr:LOW QUALITY PROTEIN: uncharacterized protein At5g41620-like [Asparagus officinalis]